MTNNNDVEPALATGPLLLIAVLYSISPLFPASPNVILWVQRGLVLSAVALVGNGFEQVRLNVTEVRFAPLPPVWIEAYIESGEPMDKAGAYGIQGAAAAWIPQIRGSYSAVMGLPLFETAELLRDSGVI
jgi:predicted house-cleaning NTP pyrophosphatase (Maf/HAM1 superfamily)